VVDLARNIYLNTSDKLSSGSAGVSFPGLTSAELGGLEINCQMYYPVT
jgi:hypothetical protein